MDAYALAEDSGASVAARRLASEAAAAARHQAELDRHALAHSFMQARLAMRLQSQFRGFKARKEVWLKRQGGRALDVKDMSVGLGVCDKPRPPPPP